MLVLTESPELCAATDVGKLGLLASQTCYHVIFNVWLRV